MFKRCGRWRVLLAHRADGTLSPAASGTLQHHLATCEACRKLAEADAALQAVLGIPAETSSREAAQTFDDRVVMTLTASGWQVARLSWLARSWRRIRTSVQALPLNFMAQIGGGAILAVSLTSFFLLPTLHFGTPNSARAALISDRMARQTLERAELPVPMESLLRTPTPRAAYLWTTPDDGDLHAGGKSHTFRPAARPIFQPKPSPPARESTGKELPDQHSALPGTTAVG